MANESANAVNALPNVSPLPYHAERRTGRRKKVFMSPGGVAVAGAMVVFLGGMVIDYQAEETRRINDILTQKNARMDKQITEINTLKKNIDDLLQRRQTVEGLQNQCNYPAQLLEELVRQVSDGVCLTSFKQEGERYTVPGVTQSDKRVSDLLCNLGAVSWLDHVELGESVTTIVANNLKEQHRLFNFTIRSRWKAESATPVKPDVVTAGK